MSNLTFDPYNLHHNESQLEFLSNHIIDDADPNNVYEGYSVIKGDYADPIWRIRRVRRNPISGFMEMLWAEGDFKYDKKFTLRASYSY